MLVDAGVSVRALVRSRSKAEVIAAAGVDLVQGDVMSPETYLDALRGVDVVFHLAGVLKAPWRESFALVNGEGPGRVAEACASINPSPALVVVSSLAAAGPAEAGRPRDETMPLFPISAYGRVKRTGEASLHGYAERVAISVLRPPMVFGGGDSAALGLFRLGNRGLGVLPTFREQRLSLIHVDDVVTAMMTIGRATMHRGVGPISAYFVAADEDISFVELANRIAQVCGHDRARIVRLPRGVTFVAALCAHLGARFLDRPAILNLDKYREAVAGDWTCDPGKLRRELQWRPHRTLNERLRETVDAYREQGLLKKRKSIE